ncbi:MAG: hypothetical protein HZA46_15745 [Planctomycetales bacterium]|nr:hypothetical protein [Planctomycetales bacterium]
MSFTHFTAALRRIVATSMVVGGILLAGVESYRVVFLVPAPMSILDKPSSVVDTPLSNSDDHPDLNWWERDHPHSIRDIPNYPFHYRLLAASAIALCGGVLLRDFSPYRIHASNAFVWFSLMTIPTTLLWTHTWDFAKTQKDWSHAGNWLYIWIGIGAFLLTSVSWYLYISVVFTYLHDFAWSFDFPKRFMLGCFICSAVAVLVDALYSSDLNPPYCEICGRHATSSMSYTMGYSRSYCDRHQSWSAATITVPAGGYGGGGDEIPAAPYALIQTLLLGYVVTYAITRSWLKGINAVASSEKLFVWLLPPLSGVIWACFWTWFWFEMVFLLFVLATTLWCMANLGQAFESESVRR